MKPIRSLTFDAKKKVLKGKFKPSTAAEREFYKQLKKVARSSGHIVDTHVDGATLKDPKKMQAELERYSKLIEPWARKQSLRLLEKVSRSNEWAYKQKSNAIGVALEQNVFASKTGAVALSLMEEQVALIKSIPIEAGRRAQKIAIEAVLEGTRAQVNSDTVEELKKQLNLSTEVAESRAMLIARTETARASASINQSRAMSIGSTQYVWRTSEDAAVRDSHKKMHGEKINWDDPPRLSDGTKGHAGTFPNCRCYAEPVFSEE